MDTSKRQSSDDLYGLFELLSRYFEQTLEQIEVGGLVDINLASSKRNRDNRARRIEKQ